MTVSRYGKGRSSGGAATRGRRRQLGGAAAAAVLASTLAACGGGETSGAPGLNWYINPDSRGQGEIAQRGSDESGGADTIEVSQPARGASAQREQERKSVG